MKKAIIIILAALLMLCVFVACDNEDIIDSLLGYMVTFDANGGEGEMESQTIPANGSTLNPNTFTRKDYYFLCWSTQADGKGTIYTDKAEIKLTEGITLYAQWMHSLSVITFDANGGEGEMEMQTVLTNVPTELNLNEFTKEYYMFGSWNTDPAGEGESFEDGETAVIEGNPTLYAQWIQPVITFDVNGGTGEMEPQAVPYGVATELEPVGTIKREGYEFVEWNTESDGTGDDYDEGDEVTLTEDLVLYAMWKGDKVQVKFDSTGGAVVKKVLEVVVGLPYGDELPQKSIKKNYEFDGWYTKAEGGTEVDEYTIVTNPYDHTLYAHWKPATYEINYELKFKDAVIDPSEDVREYEYGVGATLPSKVTKEGYVFNGWYDNDTYQGEPVTAVSETDSGDKTFYARWKKTGVEYLTATTTTWQDGYTYSLDPATTELEIASRITVNGDVTLILPDGKTLTAREGITVSEGNKLTIEGGKDGTGKLIATGEDHAAGIGGGNNKGGGTVSITGGTVIATAGENATEGIGKGNGGTDSGKLIIGEGQGLYGGDDKTTAKFISAPTDDYDGNRFKYMYAEATKYVTVTFKPNGAKETEDKTQKVPSGVDAELMANPFTHETLFFAGWATEEKGEVVYQDKDIVKFDKDTTLYAIWSDGPKVIKSTEDAITLTSGDWTITDTTVAVGGRITIDGTVNLLLPDGKTLNANSGITVSNGNTLVIDKLDSESTGTGILNATATQYGYAGIGGGNKDGYRTAGTITVKYGTVTATGGSNGAGIGGGYNGAGGTITISGGTVKADGGNSAAGIGGGTGYWEDHSLGAGGTISISGGDITATGGDGGAGIGGGFNGDGGTLSVSDGTVVANGVNNGAGIGGGAHADGGKVTIEGGTVSATGEAGGAGIGGGGNFNGDGGVGADVTIKGGVVTATGGVSTVGIGAGNGSSDHGDLTIADGVIMMVSANNTYWSVYDGSTRKQYMKVPEPIVLTSSTTAWTSGNVYTLGDEYVEIGSRITVSGSVGLLLPDGKKLTASNGITVSAGNTLVIDKYGSTSTGTGTLIAGGAGTTSQSAAGIGGGGYDQAGGTIINNGGTVIATGGEYAAGIGGGEHGNGGTVTINRGTVEAHGGLGAAGIGGGGSGGDGGTVTINGGAGEAYGGSGAAGIGGGGAGDGDGGTVTINGGTVEAYGGSMAAGIGGGFGGAGANVNITGGTVNANGGSYGEKYGFAIGKGYDDYGSKSQGSLSVTGSNLKVYGDNSTNPPTTECTDYGTTRYRYMDVK